MIKWHAYFKDFFIKVLEVLFQDVFENFSRHADCHTLRKVLVQSTQHQRMLSCFNLGELFREVARHLFLDLMGNGNVLILLAVVVLEKDHH